MYDNGYGTDPYGYQPQPQPRPSRASSFLRTVLSVLVLVVLVVLLSWGLRTFVFQDYEIPSGSMEETIMPGDMVFSEKITYYGSDPAPGDIVTFQDPEEALSWLHYHNASSMMGAARRLLWLRLPSMRA